MTQAFDVRAEILKTLRDYPGRSRPELRAVMPSEVAESTRSHLEALMREGLIEYRLDPQKKHRFYLKP